jgi:Acetyltransferase (GNAT) domain
MKEQYIRFCADTEGVSQGNRERVSIFAQPWFLDAVCGADNWGVCMDFGKNGEVNGAMPYHFVKKWGFKILKMPTLTPYMSVWLNIDPTWKTEHRLSFEKTVLKTLIEQLPKTVFSMQMYPPNLQNWLPFLWKGYRVEPLLNYIIDDLENTEQVWANFKSLLRKKIRKAEKQGITVVIRDDFEAFYNIFEKTTHRIGFKTGATKAILFRAHEEIRRQDAGKMFFALDTEGDILAAFYIIWDAKQASYWVATMDEKAGNSGATNLLMWTVLQELGRRKIPKFESAGSMAENLESFITAFGARQELFWKMTKYGNRLFAFFHFLIKKGNL